MIVRKQWNKIKMNDISARMKNNYEFPSKRKLTRRVPVVVRVDGKAFHTFTRGMGKPFDSFLIRSMVYAASCVAKQMQGFKVGYVQSDEASFLMTDYDTFETSPWFDYSQNKIESICASIMTAHFNRLFQEAYPYLDQSHLDKIAYFDARAFNVPREEVVNYFLWRALDWERNSVSMYCNHFYSPKQMHGKGKAAQHDMLHDKGKNWTNDLTMQEKNGTWLFKDGESHNILPKYSSISTHVDPLIYCDTEILTK